MKSVRARLIVLTGLAALLLALPSSASARALLVRASPAANETLRTRPEQVRLTFSTEIDPYTYSLTVVDAVGVHIDRADSRIFSDLKTIAVSLPPLEEGLYTVSYTVTARNDQKTTSDSYQFVLDFPPAQIRLIEPPNGAGFETGTVNVRVDTGDFDLTYWNHSWRLYLDGDPFITTRRPGITLRNLESGVHELQVVLVDPDGVEVQNSRSTSYVSIGEPDPQARLIALAAAGPGDPGLRLSRNQVIGLGVGVMVCLAIGILIGRRSPADDA